MAGGAAASVGDGQGFASADADAAGLGAVGRAIIGFGADWTFDALEGLAREVIA